MEDEGQQETLPVGVDELPPPQESKQQHSGKIQPTKKIDVLLKATGDAPIMKKKRWAVEGEKQVGWVAEFIRKYLKLDQNDSLMLCSSAQISTIWQTLDGGPTRISLCSM
ncbi:ubiquitin-like protein ATG12 isoform X3 [Portunus trituberculatus]|uniref:ubiquitin-like protein ATG12 isoform X3 n=1 Tax=Portunus trituberculatus TaxID=210409 RepID=UPI001E1CB2F3|nr:ubiquitin-like protein ATG12 isoform X3 [Portunus trituberculatus]